MDIFGVVLGIGVFFVIVLAYSVLSSLVVSDPSEVLVISGRSDRMGDKILGYRSKKGWAVKWPIIEKMHKMDLRNMTIDVTVTNAYSKKGVPLTIEGVANLKVCGHQPLLHNAVERFMGMPRQYLAQIARETLEGNLRGVLATLTPEQVNHDKMKFAESLLQEAEKDLQKLGLTLDNLKVQNVRDDVGYLDCIGRKKRAEQLMRNRVAEADNRSTSAIREAENLQEKTLIELENKMKILKAEAETKIADAQTRREAVIAEERASVAKEIARAQADIGVYTALIEQVKHQLKADVLQPADAAKRKAMAEAQAEMAPIREAGRATAQMLDHVIEAWQSAGPNAREVFRMQKLDGLLNAMVQTIPDVSLERLTLIGGSGANGHDGGGLAMKAAATIEQLDGALGFDVRSALSAMAASVARSATAPRPQSAPRVAAPPPAPARARPAAPPVESPRAAPVREAPLELPHGVSAKPPGDRPKTKQKKPRQPNLEADEREIIGNLEQLATALEQGEVNKVWEHRVQQNLRRLALIRSFRPEQPTA